MCCSRQDHMNGVHAMYFLLKSTETCILIMSYIHSLPFHMAVQQDGSQSSKPQAFGKL